MAPRRKCRTVNVVTRPLTALLLALASLPIAAQQTPAADNAVTRAIDPQLAALINSTPAFDNHAHPVLPPPADKTDREFDALPVDNMEPETDIVAWRPDNPQLLAAWRALWGFTPAKFPLDSDGLKQLEAARNRIKFREAGHYDVWVLDQANIGVMTANRVALGPIEGPGITPKRFRWVPYDDALLFPLDNTALAAETPDKKLFFPLEDKLKGRYLADSGLTAMPATLQGLPQPGRHTHTGTPKGRRRHRNQIRGRLSAQLRLHRLRRSRCRGSLCLAVWHAAS